MRYRFIILENEKNEILKMHKEKFHKLTNLEEDEIDYVSNENVDDENVDDENINDMDDTINYLNSVLAPKTLTFDNY